MNRQEAIKVLDSYHGRFLGHSDKQIYEALYLAKASLKTDDDSWGLREEPSSSEIPNKSENPTSSDDCISRADALALFCDKCSVYNCISKCSSYRAVKKMPSVTPQEPRCKECKWWKDSDGAFRRGIGAESQCPINTQAVYCGEGYCYKFSPKADNSEVEE